MSLHRIIRLSAKLKAVVGAGAGLASFFWFRGGTVSHRLTGVGSDVVTAIGVDVVLGIGVGAGIGFGFGFGLSCFPGCDCWRSSRSAGRPVCDVSACIEVSRPVPLVSASYSSLWPPSVAATTLVTMSVMPFAYRTSSWWYASHFSSVFSGHVFIPRHCAS